MAAITKVAKSHNIPATHAAIQFGPGANPVLLLPSHEMDDMVPEHIQMATAVYVYAGQHIDHIMKWFREEIDKREGSKH